jgi:hypothetical protein
MATIHKFGIRIEGRIHALNGTLNDAEFEKATRDGLPPGMVAWHVDESECDHPISKRVAGIRKLPMAFKPLGITWHQFIRLVFGWAEDQARAELVTCERMK